MEIKKEFLLSLYDNSTLEVRETLELEYGKELFKKDITEIVKKESDAQYIYNTKCKKFGDQMFYKLSENDNNYIDAFISALVISKALNEGWEPDWNNTSQKKYTVSYNSSTHTYCTCHYYYCNSSLIFFKSEKLAEYFINQFPDICEILYGNNKH